MELPAGELLVEKTETAWILSLRGEWDMSNSGALTAELEAVFSYGTKVVIDLRQTRFLDSSILAALIKGYERSQQKAEDAFVVIAPDGSWTRRILDTVGLGSHLPVYEDMEAALAALD
jgi:anti-anti-sigma factor